MDPKENEPTRWWDLPAALILLVAVYLAALRLSATNWTDELDIIHVVAFFGLASGLALGQSLFKPRRAVSFAAVYGMFILGWQLGRTFGTGVLWSERMISIFGRLGISIGDLAKQRAVTDPILFLLLMSVLFWVLSAHAGYTLTRHANTWRATLPTGLTLFIIHIHDPLWPNRTWFVASYIFLSLLLLSRLNFLHSWVSWKQRQTHLPPYAGLDFLRATMLAGGILVLLAWTAPALASSVPPVRQAWQAIARPWYETRAKMSTVFASLQATVGIVEDYYGEILPLGRGNALNDNVVLTVQAPPRPAAGVRYYWRARIYDTYDGTQWKTSQTETKNILPEDPALPFADMKGRWETTFTFMPGIPLNTVYTVPQPQWISRPVAASVVANPDGTVDLFALRASPTIRPGEVYEVHSSLTNVTTSQLQASGTSYPDWIAERYLQVPDTITPRTLALAQQIAEGFDNPYDITHAVTQWLRENVQYSDIIPSPPPGQDIIDWMLFDLRQGFCNYYSTAEIVMLRSLGIPARMAVGYAQGQRDPETNTYTVRQRDAHAWPEVYFPGTGWVEFEPTLNQRPLRRPLGDPVDEDDTASPSANNPGAAEQQNLEELLGFESQENQQIIEDATDVAEETTGIPLWILIATSGVLLIAISVFAWYRTRSREQSEGTRRVIVSLPAKIERGIRRIGLKPPAFVRRWAYNASLPVQARAYQEMNRSLTRLGSPPQPNNTPAERAETLSMLLPTASTHIDVLLNEYQTFTYGTTNGSNPSGTSVFIAQQAARSIRNQTWITIGQQFLARFQEPKQRKSLV